MDHGPLSMCPPGSTCRLAIVRPPTYPPRQRLDKGNIGEVIEHYAQEISRFLDGSPDPRGPRSTRHFDGRPVWITEPLWVVGDKLKSVACMCSSLGMHAEATRAAELLSDLHGRAQSPEELAAMMTATGPVPAWFER